MVKDGMKKRCVITLDYSTVLDSEIGAAWASYLR